MKSILFVFVMSFLLPGGNTTSQEITGKTMNFKIGALLAADDGNTYTLPEVHRWPEEFADKRVVVAGKVIEVKREIKALREGELRQGINIPHDTVVIEKHIIEAKYKLAQ